RVVIKVGAGETISRDRRAVSAESSPSENLRAADLMAEDGAQTITVSLRLSDYVAGTLMYLSRRNMELT
ncbi:MAG: hypothetical protein WBZ57_14210, partial [Pseudomonas graminis]